ncbi:hypothetical protein HMPREF1992_00902 [Selenomonas sp. oral taxon 892 str. F0426]|nr:hypothetical protein HMPREF1992_00902 [Selenomonas sp. oral taxon 892 str. F0426]
MGSEYYECYRKTGKIFCNEGRCMMKKYIAGAVTSLRDGAGHTAVDYCLERNDLENARLIQQY